MSKSFALSPTASFASKPRSDRSRIFSYNFRREVLETALDALVQESGASVSIINRDDEGHGFLVQDLVNDGSAVKMSVDFSGPDPTCPVIVRGPSAEASATISRVCQVIDQATEEMAAELQRLPEKLTRQSQAHATDGSQHFRLDVDESFLNPPPSHRQQQQQQQQQQQRRVYDQSLEDIRNYHLDHGSASSGDEVLDDGQSATTDVSYVSGAFNATEGESLGGGRVHLGRSFNLNSSRFTNASARSANAGGERDGVASPPRQHGGAKISSYQLSKVLSKLRAHSYDLGGVNMTAEFQRADTTGTGYLSRADFARTLRRLVRLQEHELQYLFELFDGNGNDIIEYREFVQFMLQNGEEAARQIATAEKFNRARRASSGSMEDGAPVQKISGDGDFFNELYRNQQTYRSKADAVDAEGMKGDPRLFVKGFSLGIPPPEDVDGDDDDLGGDLGSASEIDGHHDELSFDGSRRYDGDANKGDSRGSPSDSDGESKSNAHFRATIAAKHTAGIHGHSHPTFGSTGPSEKQIKWLSKNVQQLTSELEEVKEHAKQQQLLYNAGRKEVDMARQLCADLRNKLVAAAKQRTQDKNKIYQSDQIIQRLTKNVETSKVLLSRVHEQCEVWKEQAQLSQKNLETLKLRTSEEIEDLRKTLHTERQSWKDAETKYELEILRLKDESAATVREKNVVIANLHNEIADAHNDHKFELQQMEEKMHLVEQAKGLSDEAWAAKSEKLVNQWKQEAAQARAHADQRLAELTAHKTRAADAAEVAAHREQELKQQVHDLQTEKAKLGEELQNVSNSLGQRIHDLLGEKREKAVRLWGMLRQSAKLRGIVRRGFGFSKKKKKVTSPSRAHGSDDEEGPPETESEFSCPSEFEDDHDGEDPQQRMLDAMERNVAEVERTKLEMANTQSENDILRSRVAQLELQYGMQGAAIKALRLATMAAKLREKESVKRSCVDHMQLKDMQITIERLHQQLSRASVTHVGGPKPRKHLAT